MKNLSFLLLFSTFTIFSQVGINTVSPDPSSMLDVTSTNKGLLVPRISLTSITDNTTIASPLTSLLIYNTATVSNVTPGFYYWTGTQWSKLATTTSVESKWSLLGNAGTDAAINFIGTTDNKDVVFKRNNVFAGRINDSNTAFGVNSLISSTTGLSNTAIGLNALKVNTTGNYNTAMGVNSLFSNLNGSSNTATGASTLYTNTSGSNNTANGFNALKANTTGTGNTASGVNALLANTTGHYNTSLGYGSLIQNLTGIHNIGIGANSLKYNTSGNYNIAIGSGALENLTAGNNNIAIGYSAIVPNPSASNQIRIGDTSITYAGAQVAWTITSDRRLKNTIEDSNLGLTFINQLRPVSYYRNNDESHKLEYGLIAQELNDILKSNSLKQTGIVTEDKEGMLSVRYNDLMAPIIKGIQEQTEEMKQLKSENKTLKLKQIAIEKELEEIKSLLLKKK